MSAYIKDRRERRAAIKAAIRASAQYFALLGEPWDVHVLVDRLANEPPTTSFGQKHYAALVSFRKLNARSRRMMANSIMVDIHDEMWEAEQFGNEKQVQQVMREVVTEASDADVC